MEIQKTILKICMEKGFLLDKEMLELLSDLDEESARDLVDGLSNLRIKEKVITKTLFSKNIERIRNVLVGGMSKTVIERFFINLGYVREETDIRQVPSQDQEVVGDTKEGKIRILSSPVIEPKKVVVKDFVNYFKLRYEQIKGLLEARGLENLTSIRKIGGNRGSYTIIVSILSKRMTKNKNLLFEVEDGSGGGVVLVNQNKKEIFDKAKDLLLDDVVAISVSGTSEMLFANDVIFPECVLSEKRRHDKEVLVAFASDLHIGSNNFLEENVLRFIRWLNGKEGDEKQRELAKKVRYLFLNGDNVDGVGVFPGQEKHLKILDIKEQYKKFVEMLKLIRGDIKIIIGPGQHDAVWVGVPQPIIGEEYAHGLYKLENVTLVSNPCLVEIDGGFKILMYHGAAMHPVVGEIEDLRLNYGHDFPTRTSRELLKRRHLAPTHGSMDYVPMDKKDHLVIDVIPDVFTTGDWHKSEVSVYNNILLIASSCWQTITPFEEKVGNKPDYCKVPLLNLKTREIKILDFYDVQKKVEEVECKEEGDEIVCEVKEAGG